MIRRHLLTAVLAAAALVVGCSNSPGVVPVRPGTDVRPIDDYVDWARANRLLDISPDLERARPIFARVVEAAKTLHVTAHAFTWELHILHMEGLNVHCDKGRVIVFQDVLNTTRPLPDEFAAAVAHEIVHCLRDHKVPKGIAAICVQEYEADDDGMRILEAAGYGRDAMARMLDKITAASIGRWGSMGCGDRAARFRAKHLTP